MFRTVGHDKAVRALTRAIDNDGIAHAYLIAGGAADRQDDLGDGHCAGGQLRR